MVDVTLIFWCPIPFTFGSLAVCFRVIGKLIKPVKAFTVAASPLTSLGAFTWLLATVWEVRFWYVLHTLNQFSTGDHAQLHRLRC